MEQCEIKTAKEKEDWGSLMGVCSSPLMEALEGAAKQEIKPVSGSWELPNVQAAELPMLCKN